MSEPLLEEWQRVIAYAWTNSEFMEDLRKNPMAALEKDEYREKLNLQQLKGNYFPLPDRPSNLPSTEDEIVEYLKNNIRLFGIMDMSAM
jgi:hypothetical protein